MIPRLLAGLARLVSGAGVRWVGCRPEPRQRIYFANHTSHLDFVVLWSALPLAVRRLTRPVAAEDYWRAGRLRYYVVTRVFNGVLVPRGRAGGSADRDTVAEAARRTVERVAEALGREHSLILFPEGTRGPGPDVAPFKSGLYHLCLLRPDVELVPVYLENLNRILPKGHVLPVPLLSSVTFGAPIRFQADEPKAVFLDRTRAALVGLRRAQP
jgi:1-acyl-sn-glycerol-3-phosphate acyltransferase